MYVCIGLYVCLYACMNEDMTGVHVPTRCRRKGFPKDRTVPKTVWFLVGNEGMDPHSSPYIIPNNSPHNPLPHSPLSTPKP